MLAYVSCGVGNSFSDGFVEEIQQEIFFLTCSSYEILSDVATFQSASLEKAASSPWKWFSNQL